MNIRDIKMKARSVLANQKNIFYVFIFISIITTLVDYAGASFSRAMIPFASLIISIIMLPFSHGNIVASFMVVNERGVKLILKMLVLLDLKDLNNYFLLILSNMYFSL